MRIRVHPAFLAYLLSIAALSSWETALCSSAALALHEAGHYALIRLLREPVDRIELTPFGGVMTYAPGKCASKGLRGFAIAAAGPMSNYLALLALALPPAQALLGISWARHAAAANWVMLCLNLLPVLPLDGGAMAFSIGYYVFPAARLIAMLSYLGMGCGAAILGLALYGFVKLGLLNCSLLLIGGYLIVCAGRSKSAMLAENLYAVVQERQEHTGRVRRIRLHHVPCQTPVLDLLEPMQKAACAAFVFEDERGVHVLSEKDVCRLLLQSPLCTIARAFDADAGEKRQKSK